MESIPNGSFTTSCVPVPDDDGDGLELDFDSDEEGNGEEGNDGDCEGNGGGGEAKKARGVGMAAQLVQRGKKGGATSQRMVLQSTRTWMAFVSK